MERNRNLEKITLEKFRAAIPFLNEVPDEIYFKLNPWSFYLPKGEVQKLRLELETKVGHYVMTYQRDKFDLESPLEEHLCALLDMPDLNQDPKSLELLNHYESLVNPKNISLVVYRKPVTLIDPYQSWLAPIYRIRGLIS